MQKLLYFYVFKKTKDTLENSYHAIKKVHKLKSNAHVYYDRNIFLDLKEI